MSLYVIRQGIEYFAIFLEFAIFIRVIVSWLPIGRDGNVIRILYVLTEPILGPVRNALRKSPLGGPGMRMDFSPIIAYALIEIIKSVLIVLILQIGTSF